MAYCPNCEYEYRNDLTVCPDCNEKLLSTKPAASTSAVVPDDSWVQVGTVKSNGRAGQAKEALDSNNIPSVVMPSKFGPGDVYQALAGAVKPGSDACLIMVPREFKEEAEIIIETVLGEDGIAPEA